MAERPTRTKVDGFTYSTALNATTTTTTTTYDSGGGGSVLATVERSRDWTSDVTQRVATLVPLIAATLLCNVVTMVVLTCSRYRSVNSRINIFIVNLAVGDLAVCSGAAARPFLEGHDHDRRTTTLAVCCFTMCTEVGWLQQFRSFIFQLQNSKTCLGGSVG